MVPSAQINSITCHYVYEIKSDNGEKVVTLLYQFTGKCPIKSRFPPYFFFFYSLYGKSSNWLCGWGF